MKIEYRIGDLLDSDVNVIAHGCNAQGVMKSGIAKSIRERYPLAYTKYREAYVNNDHELICGQVIRATINNNRTILNIISQKYYGRDPNIVYVDYEAIKYAMLTINLIATCQGFHEVAFPLIGAGLANGDWTKISSIIEETTTFNPIVYTLNGVIPGAKAQ